MLVFKFGGASVKDAASFRNVAGIIADHSGSPVLVVVSALGKTTNALEEICKNWFDGQTNGAFEILNKLNQTHAAILKELFPEQENEAHLIVGQLFRELEQMLSERPFRHFDFHYDQMVSFGELFSSVILNGLLRQNGLKSYWLDVREVIQTDQAYREAKIDWHGTRAMCNLKVRPLLENNLVVTQGFIGRAIDRSTTTLGREGSDFTAAVFSNLLQAEKLVIWKDVPGVLNADPKIVPSARLIPQLTYREAVEMTYYGAQVIHPKTIKPLQNLGIPLQVRSFLKKEAEGTLIKSQHITTPIPPVLVFKGNQAMVTLTTKDFSFMAEDVLGEIYAVLSSLRIKANMAQHAAISIRLCVDEVNEKISQLTERLSHHFEVGVTTGLALVSIRHYPQEYPAHIGKFSKELLLVQRSGDTIQFVAPGNTYAENPDRLPLHEPFLKALIEPLI